MARHNGPAAGDYPSYDEDDIAIIGTACRVAGADSPPMLWDILAGSKDVQQPITRFNGEGFYSVDGGPRGGLTNVQRSYFINGDVSKFDNGFFAIGGHEAAAMDPQQRVLLEVAHEAFENAGITLDRLRGSDTAVFASTTSPDYLLNTLRDLGSTPKYTSTGSSSPAILANRLSYFFDLHGPSMVVDTACSSTMVSLHYACQSLKSGESKMALVSGVNLILNPDMFVHMSQLGFLSPGGRCRSFDSKGDGYARGEGALAIVLKPVRQALEDGDPVRAVIKATRINHNGRTQGISLPSKEEQQRNLESLYAGSGIDPASIQYFEAHGTGTAAGDPIELSAINSVFFPQQKTSQSDCREKLIVGSVKSNIGHLESCAALAGLVKTIECLERQLVPPQMHFESPNPKIDFTNISIPTSVLPWPENPNGGKRRAAINSFGFGGVNAHTVLEEAPLQKLADSQEEDAPKLFKLSASTDVALSCMLKSMADYVEAKRPNLTDLAHTLVARRTTLKRSVFVSATTHEGLLTRLRATDVPKHAVTKSSEVSETPQRIGFIFTGQGAQWPGMGAELLKHSALFHSVVQQCDDVLRSLPDAPSWTAADELSKDKASSRVHVSSLSQPLCTIVQLGLVEIWRSWGVVPCAVVGHSSGEVAAAYAAGLLSLRDAVVVAFYRGLYLGSDGTIVKPKGGMCAVGLSEASAKQLLRPYAEKVGLAAVNSPSSCTLSGDIESVQEIAEQCKQDGTFCRVLRVDMAYHSHHMLEHASKYEDAMRQAGVVSLSSPESRIQMYSSVYERHLSPTDCSPSYWKQNMTSPVLFTSALKTMMSDSERPYALVELGPHPALKGPVGDTLADIGITEVPYFSSLFRGKPDVEAMYESAGTMIAVGIDLDTIRVNATQKHAVDSGAPFSVTYSTGRVLKDLPTYPWDHTVSHWHESRASKNVRFRQFPRHNLLGARLSEDTSLHMGWSNTLSFKETPWLADLGKKSQEFLPETVLICMALEAARQFAVLRDLQESSVQMKSLEFESSVPLSWFKDESGVETQLALDTNGHVSGGAFTISVLSNRESDVWVKACQGTLVLATSNPARGTTLKSRIATAQLKHDAQFEERIRTSGYTQPEKSTGFTVNPRSATGNIDGLDHSVLSAILQLPQMLVRGSGLPGKYRVRSIKTLETHSVPIPPTAPAAFLAEVEQSGSVTGVVSVDVAAMADSPGFISIQGLNVERYDDMAIEAPLKSLFYKSELAPDISSSSFSAEGLMRIEDIISLVTHKHPDADIGLVGLDGQVIKTVLEALRAYRPRFRSVTVVGDYPSMEEMTLSAVSVVPRLASSAKLHLLLEPLEAEAESQDLEAHLHPQGVRFTTSASDSSTWTLTRQQKHNTPSDVPVTIISSPSAAAEDPPYADALRASFPLSDHLTMSSESAMPNPKHVIIIDGPTSMLARTPATVWLAQLQSVISSVETLLWVNIQRNSDPFSSVAGSFIRTLKAEDPTLRAASLVISDPSSSARIAELVKTVFHDLHSGASEETELVVQSDSVHLLRYVPDDERNASTGAASPVYVQRNIAKSEYALAVTAREHVALRSASPRIQHQMKAGTVLVDVSASTIDHADVSEFLSPKEGSSLGLFFAGRVRKSASKTISPGMQVVGWMAGAHRSSVECTEQNIFTLSHEVDPKDAAVCFAAAASAYAILDGFARIRFGDYFDLRVSGLLATAISKLCDIYGATVSETCPKTADFVIAYDAQKLTVNSRPVSVKHYLESGDRVHAMIRLFGQLLDHDGGVSARAFEIDSIGDAFAFAATKPLEVVIKHKSNDAILPVLVMHNPAPKLFSSDGAYILLGGMGGLGQHLSTWMIRNGAKTLITISRSGLSNEEARSTAQQVESLGGEVEAFALDVSDAAALNTALSDVRSRHKILGCLNLAMVLQDAPFSKMTAQRWDTAMRVKVEGSWNLHQATLADDLDFYLLFSSVSSITGNRSQSNYATGNAFQNALAAYRRSIGIPGISIALGSMSGIGVLANETALEYCAQMGHSTVGPAELEQVMESAIISSQNPDCPPLMGMGLEIFEKIDGTVQKTAAQSQAFWTDMPEFGALMRHSLSGSQTQSLSIQERMQEANEEEALHVLLEAFTESLSALMGYAANAIDPESSIAAYGLDSLNAMSCRYWFFQNIGTDVPVFDILGSKSIRALVARVLAKFKGNQSGSGDKAVELPQPTRHGELAIRPLSHSQQRLWFLQSFLTDKSIYNLVLVCHIEGKVDVPAFKQAWTTLLQRHEALHSRLVDTKNGLQQLPTSLSEFPITEVVASEEEFDEKVATITQAARSYVFNFETPELVRGWLLKSPKGWRFFLTSHHIAWDRSSVPTIFAETTSAYKALVAGKPVEVELKPVEYQFIDYTLWQEECLQKSAYLDPLIKYWSDRLEGRPEAVSLLPMALVDKRPAVKQLRTSHVHFSLDVATSQAMRAFCAKHGATPFMFSACSLSALVHRLTGDADVILGIADGDRGHSAFDNMIGFTVNMLPIRSNHNSKSPFVSILEDYRTACLGAYEHRALPFDYLLSKLEIPRRTSHSPIFQITVNYQVHGSFSEVDYGDFKFVDYDHYNARQQMDLSLGIEEDATGALECDIEFDTALYDEAGMRHLADMYETFVKSVVGSSESTTLGDIRILTANDERFYEELLESQQEDYESIMAECESSLFPVLFDRAVAAKPEKVALLDTSKAFTWSDVDNATRKIASELLSCGIIKGASVGLFAEQSTDLVLAAWAIARAGAAYVPLDPDFPDSRIMDMMEDVGMTVCVTDGSNGALARLVGCGLKASHVFNVGQILTATPDTKQDVSLPQVVKEDPFCCVFTSGSTGRPKGIMIGHGPLRYHQESYSREVGLREDDRLLLASAMVFDASLCAIYAGVLKGATVVIAGREARYSANAMVDLIFQHKVSSLLITPTQASFLLATPSNRKRLEQWTSLRSLVLGGEASPTRLLGDLFALNLGAGEARIFNAYGPSESTVSCSITQLSSEHVDRGVVPLGLSQFPSRLYILDENRARVPVGVPGELWVGGPAVNQGYVGRPDLTKRAFLPNPFAPGLIYRTGDLFSLSRGGHLVVHGRMSGDRQVKIRGMRVELDEIEIALWEMVQELDGDDIVQVDNLAVVYHKKNDGGSVIAAYIATSKMAIDKSEQAYVRKCLRQSLGDRLPRHMMPSSFVFVDEIPSTVAGKTDYKTMSAWTPPKPDIVMPTNGVNGDHRDVLTPLQLDIAAIWKAVLGLVPDDDTAANDATVQEAHQDVYIGLKDDFFALGGHSLLLMKLQDQLQRKFGVALGLADMFGSPTIAGIQRLLKAHSDWQKAGMEAKYAEQITGGHDGGAVNGLETNGHIETIDWASETTLPADITTLLDKATRTIANHNFQNAGSILITGASSMIGAHFLHHIITRTTLTVYCVAEPVTTHKEAKGRILDALDYHNLREDCRADINPRIVAFSGQLSHPSLGLTDEEVKLLVERADTIFHLDSDVSLLKNYAGVRAGNVGAVLFLTRLAAGYYASSIPTLRQLKPLHYLSTWGVPHLQVWNATTLSPPDTIIKDEIEMHNMTPSPEPGLAYLKARWACERLLGDAAARGLPVTIFRPSMCANSERSDRGLKTDDINRRILEGSLQTGCVPDFGSEKGGGMSWITVDWLVDSMAQLSSLHQNPDGIDATSKSALQIHHLVADTHLPYTDLAARLETAYDGRKMRAVSPAEWFAALRSTGNVDMAMQASVLESWWEAGWVGFRLQDETTRRELRSRSGPKVKINATATGSESSTDDERGGSPKSGSVSGGSDDFVLVEEAGSGRQRVMERDWIMRCIIGEKGF